MKDTLVKVLKLFYAEARKADGTSHSKSNMNSLRVWLNQHFKATRDFDIINDSKFTNANKVFGVKCVDLKRQGLAKIEHKPPIREEDLKKLYESTVFGLNDPKKLQNKLFYWSNDVLLLPRKAKSLSTKEDIFHSTRTAPKHATCAKQRMN